MYWDMFVLMYRGALTHLRQGPWYFETNMRTKRVSHYHFNSLQAFWPGIQILIGDIPLALATIDTFFSIWNRYSGLPERLLLNSFQPHGSERQYPLRPELIESIYYAYQATSDLMSIPPRRPAPQNSETLEKAQSKLSFNSKKRNKNNKKGKKEKKEKGERSNSSKTGSLYFSRDRYLWMGYQMLETLENRTKSRFGYSILNNVVNGEKGDYMPSYFLAETCKYLLLLFDDNHPIHRLESNFIFSTEGRILPLFPGMSTYIQDILDSYPDLSANEKEQKTKIKEDLMYLPHEIWMDESELSVSSQKPILDKAIRNGDILCKRERERERERRKTHAPPPFRWVFQSGQKKATSPPFSKPLPENIASVSLRN